MPRRYRGFALALALTLGVSGVTAVVAPTMASAQAADRDPNALEGQFVAGVNALRTSQGLAPFIVDAAKRPRDDAMNSKKIPRVALPADVGAPRHAPRE